MADLEHLRRQLGLAPDASAVLTRLDAIGPPPAPAAVPDDRAAASLLARMTVSADDIQQILAARPDPSRTPEHWWLLQRCRHELQLGMGGTGTISGWPSIEDSTGRWLYVWVFLSTTDHLREYYAQQGIPDEIAWATMAELGTQLFYYRSIHGTGGLSAQEWLTAHFRGVLFRLGRLLYERQSIWFDTDGPRRGDYAVGVHIPRGRLTPESCDESFALARTFFARHFPQEQPCRYATCVSWVLDPQLASYLKADSNIIRFQRRFTILPQESESAGDQETVEAIFARPFRDLDELPRTTSLERAITTHLQDGGHWYFRTGWLRLDP